VRLLAVASFQRALVPLAAGIIWGLGLARALAESFPASPTFYFWPTFFLALGVGILAAVGARRSTVNFSPLFLPAVYVLWPGVAPRVGWTLLLGGLVLAVLFYLQERFSPRRFEWWVAGVLALTTGGLYLRTLGPAVGQADTFEFQVVAPTLGVAHPTGYPLYILSGKLFSLLPIGNVAWRVNLTSTVFAVGATVLLYGLVLRIAYHVLPLNSGTGQHAPRNTSLVAALAALAYGLSRVFWSQAVVAEVYALHNLFVAIVLWLLVRMLEQKTNIFTFYSLLLPPFGAPLLEESFCTLFSI